MSSSVSELIESTVRGPFSDCVGRVGWSVGREVKSISVRHVGDESLRMLNTKGMIVESLQPAPQPEESRVIAPGLAARLIGVSRRTLERLVQRREFPPPLKVGSKSLFFRSDVEAFLKRLAEQRNGST